MAERLACTCKSGAVWGTPDGAETFSERMVEPIATVQQPNRLGQKRARYRHLKLMTAVSQWPSPGQATLSTQQAQAAASYIPVKGFPRLPMTAQARCKIAKKLMKPLRNLSERYESDPELSEKEQTDLTAAAIHYLNIRHGPPPSVIARHPPLWSAPSQKKPRSESEPEQTDLTSLVSCLTNCWPSRPTQTHSQSHAHPTCTYNPRPMSNTNRSTPPHP